MSQASPLSFASTDPFEYFLEFRQRTYPARRVTGSEGVSRLYAFDFRYRTQPGEVPEPDDFVGNEAVLRVERGGVVLRNLVAIMTEASLEATKTGDPELFVRLEPRMALLQHRSDNRVFRDLTVPEIVTQVLGENGVGTILRLRDTFRRRPYTVTYGETLFAFVSRLLEEEGIFYFFPEWIDAESRPKRDDLLHGVVLGDGSPAFEPVEGDDSIELRATAGLMRQRESVFAVKRVARMRAGKVSLRDWNLEKPSLPMDVSADLPRYDDDSVVGPEVYSYPGKYDVPVDGLRLARLQAEALAAAAARITGRSDTARLMAGRTIRLSPAPELEALGVDPDEVVLLALTHDYARGKDANADGESETKLEVAFEALPIETPFRPPQLTPRPVITNPLTAFVVGPQGEDIHTDAFGRVKIHFPWDRLQPKDERASHWVPVMQENTGTSAAIPRIGWEVAIGFVGGDPDRPFVLGRVYNAADPFPEALPAEKTKSALRSLSSPTRDGQNEIWMEDAAGRELMSVQAEKDQNVVVAKNKTEDVKNVEENTVVKDETIFIGRDQKVTVKKQQLLSVAKDQRLTVGGTRSRVVDNADQLTVAKNRAVSIGTVHTRTIGGFDNLSEKKSLSETVGGVELEVSLKENTTNTKLLQTLTVGGAVVEIAGKGKEEKAELLRLETVGAAVITAVKQQFALVAKKVRTTKVGAMLTATAKTYKLASDDAQVTVTARTTAELEGTSQVLIEAGGSSVLLAADGITIKSAGKVEITASGANNLLSTKADIA